MQLRIEKDFKKNRSGLPEDHDARRRAAVVHWVLRAPAEQFGEVADLIDRLSRRKL